MPSQTNSSPRIQGLTSSGMAPRSFGSGSYCGEYLQPSYLVYVSIAAVDVGSSTVYRFFHINALARTDVRTSWPLVSIKVLAVFLRDLHLIFHWLTKEAVHELSARGLNHKGQRGKNASSCFFASAIVLSSMP